MVVRVVMKKIYISFILFFISCSSLMAETLYMNCEETIQEVREATYDDLFVKGEIIGNNYVRLKNNKIIDIYFAYPGGEAFDLLRNKKVKKNSLGFTVEEKYKDKNFKTHESFKFLKPLEDYVYKRTTYFWSKGTDTDGENVSDYDGSGRCEFINKKEFLKLINK